MFQKLVSHNKDLRSLVEKGYAVTFDSNHLVVRDIPYLDCNRKLQTGAIVTKLEFVDMERVIQQDHQIFFTGSVPHNLDGSPVKNLGGGSCQLVLSTHCSDVVVQRSFSNKPRKTGRYKDFFEKIENYANIISGPAMELYGASPYTFEVAEDVVSDSVFKIHDTLTSRAEISELSAKFENDVVAIIGLGGTGASVLDFLVKTPVREIRAFDLDTFHVHNAFRSPGKLDKELELGRKKTEVYHSRYDNFRDGLTFKSKFVDASCASDFEGVTFAFVCVDKGSSRAGIFELLIDMGIPFIDVGMGLNRKHGALNGMLRTTYYSTEKGKQVRGMGLAEVNDNPNDLYQNNIQIGELNALNACLAVIKFKQLRGFYHEDSPLFHLLFKIGNLKSIGEADFNDN